MQSQPRLQVRNTLQERSEGAYRISRTPCWKKSTVAVWPNQPPSISKMMKQPWNIGCIFWELRMCLGRLFIMANPIATSPSFTFCTWFAWVKHYFFRNFCFFCYFRLGWMIVTSDGWGLGESSNNCPNLYGFVFCLTNSWKSNWAAIDFFSSSLSICGSKTLKTSTHYAAKTYASKTWWAISAISLVFDPWQGRLVIFDLDLGVNRNALRSATLQLNGQSFQFLGLVVIKI